MPGNRTPVRRSLHPVHSPLPRWADLSRSGILKGRYQTSQPQVTQLRLERHLLFGDR